MYHSPTPKQVETLHFVFWHLFHNKFQTEKKKTTTKKHASTVCGMLGNTVECKSSGQAFDSCMQHCEGLISVLLSQHFRRLFSACLAFMHTVCTKIIAHVKDPMSSEKNLMASVIKTQVRHNSGRIIKMIIVATPNGRRKRIWMKTEWINTCADE